MCLYDEIFQFLNYKYTKYKLKMFLTVIGIFQSLVKYKKKLKKKKMVNKCLIYNLWYNIIHRAVYNI